MRKLALIFLVVAYVESGVCWWLAKKYFKHLTRWYGIYLLALLTAGTLYFLPQVVR